MGRPSKLSEKRWGELLTRLAAGERASALGREFRISPTSISKRVSQNAETVRNLAHTVAEVEGRVEALPQTQQKAVRDLADQLKGISSNLTIAAQLGSRTAAKLHELAARKVEGLTEATMREDLPTIAALGKTANEHASLGVSLMQANKDSLKGSDEHATLGSLLGGLDKGA